MEETRKCWICFGTAEEDPRLVWVHPCRCKGSEEWVHETCLLRWITLKQNGDTSAKVKCSLCTAEYRLFVPKGNVLMLLLRKVGIYLDKTCFIDFICVCIFGFIASICCFVACTVYAAYTHGELTVTLIFEEHPSLIELANPLARAVFLTVIPVTFIVLEMIPWVDCILDFLRKIPRVPILRHILPSTRYNEATGERMQPPVDRCGTLIYRAFIEGLVFPVVAKLFGHVFSSAVRSSWKRWSLGALCYIGTRGVLRMYYKQKTYSLRSQLRVLNHREGLT